ncbi:MAG: chorismate-binding protein [Bdellovibrionaceae bacterium]|nr:chorismate-binding protein [Pseudobdellovibrionaceae bacterium]
MRGVTKEISSTSAAFAFFDHLACARGLFFQNPIKRVSAWELSEVHPALCAIDDLQRKGYYLAGFISYEAGYALLDIPFEADKMSNVPLIDFYAFETVEERTLGPSSDGGFFNFQCSETFSSYQVKFNQIQEHLHSGNSYQVNLTFQNTCQSQGRLEDLYYKLSQAQPVSYGMWANLPEMQILSLSPELFFNKTKTHLLTKPMKGTLGIHERIKDLDKDHYDKLYAENVMIVDLLRNDFAKIVDPCSIRVDKLMELEQYPTLQQLVSTISGTVDVTLPFSTIIKGLFPCGSITGAPKRRTMELIRDIESRPRGIYTGTIGYITPENDMRFSVAIRTLVKEKEKWSYGVGGGIVVQSTAQDEFNEAQSKASFIARANTFSLIETMLYNGSYIENEGEHLERIMKSARVFRFSVDDHLIRQKLMDAVREKNQPYKVRLLVDQSGQISVETSLIAPLPSVMKVRFSKTHTTSTDIFLKHKTTQRYLYEQEWQKAQRTGFYEVLFLNEKDHVTEASRHNVFILKQNRWYTPPIEDGLLPGIERQKTIERLDAEEKHLLYEDILTSEKILLTNSIRGAVEVVLESTP